MEFLTFEPDLVRVSVHVVVCVMVLFTPGAVTVIYLPGAVTVRVCRS